MWADELGSLIPAPRVRIAGGALRGRGWLGCSLAVSHGHCPSALRPLSCVSRRVLLCPLVLLLGVLASGGVAITGLAWRLHGPQGRALASFLCSRDVPLLRCSVFLSCPGGAGG